MLETPGKRVAAWTRAPGPRSDGCFIRSAPDGAFLFGGMGRDGSRNSVFTYNLTTNRWTYVSVIGNTVPAPRTRMSCVLLNQTAVLVRHRFKL